MGRGVTLHSSNESSYNLLSMRTKDLYFFSEYLRFLIHQLFIYYKGYRV